MHADPEMVIVGGGTICFPDCATPASVEFLSDTGGHVSSFERLFGSKIWQVPKADIIPYGYAITGEFSTNLKWVANGDFYYVDPNLGHPVIDQGIALQPDYNTSSAG